MSEPDYKSFSIAMINDAFEGFHIDGCDVQELAVKYGILIKTKYDPEMHGENEVDAVKGDDWYEFAK